MCVSWLTDSDPAVTINVIGIIINFAGAMLVASGVYLTSEQLRSLSPDIKTKKLTIALTSVLIDASRACKLGVMCFAMGALFQIVSATFDQIISLFATIAGWF
jgi:hypothetical protein